MITTTKITGPEKIMELKRNSELNAGTIRIKYPILCMQLRNVGDSGVVTFNGKWLKIIRVGTGCYDFVVEKIK